MIQRSEWHAIHYHQQINDLAARLRGDTYHDDVLIMGLNGELDGE